MMNTAEILNHVDLRSSTVKEVFSSITTSESKATRSAATTSAVKIAEKINPLVAASPIDYIRQEEVDAFMAFATEYADKEGSSLRHKLFVKPFQGVLLKGLCFALDLNYEQVSKLGKSKDSRYDEVGDAIVLAGLYLSLKGEE